jgi:uncharacterized protein (DUF2237 family)
MITSFLSGDQEPPVNVLGGKLEACCYKPMTGFYRDGFCNTGPQDYGVHVVCAIMTDEFLNYSSSCGNDLITPNPRFNFPGLKAGDQWCLCAVRWKEAEAAGISCPVILESTHKNALQIIDLDTLKKYAVKKAE